MRIFVSSSFQDLQDYRLAAIRILRQLGHEVVAMEDFVAASMVPLEFVLKKVEQCELFVGLFAWRYGYVPKKKDGSKPKPPIPGIKKATYGITSITHYEYLYAKQNNIKCLAFLLDESVPWPPHLIDGFSTLDPLAPKDSKAIRTLRSKLQEDAIVSYFSNPSDLEARVSAAVTVAGMSKQVWTNLADVGKVSDTIGDSAPDEGIRKAILEADQNRVLKIDLIPKHPWWSTRLFLISMLAERLTDVCRILVVSDGTFVGLLATRWIISVLETKHPILTKIAKKVSNRKNINPDLELELTEIIKLWREAFGAEADSMQKEKAMKITLTPNVLRRWFGDTMLQQPVRISDLSRATVIDLMRILDYPSEFVPIATEHGFSEEINPTPSDPTEEQELIKVVDKSALNAKLGQSYVSELMDDKNRAL